MVVGRATLRECAVLPWWFFSNRPIVGPNPRNLSSLKAVFYEATVIFHGTKLERYASYLSMWVGCTISDPSLRVRRFAKHHGENLEQADIAIGFAVSPYQPFEVCLLHLFLFLWPTER